MENYSIEIKRSAAKEIARLPHAQLIRITDKIASLANDPRPVGCKKLSGEEKYRLRVERYRILYKIEDAQLIVYVVKVAHRKEAYR